MAEAELVVDPPPKVDRIWKLRSQQRERAASRRSSKRNYDKYVILYQADILHLLIKQPTLSRDLKQSREAARRRSQQYRVRQRLRRQVMEDHGVSNMSMEDHGASTMSTTADNNLLALEALNAHVQEESGDTMIEEMGNRLAGVSLVRRVDVEVSPSASSDKDPVRSSIAPLMRLFAQVAVKSK